KGPRGQGVKPRKISMSFSGAAALFLDVGARRATAQDVPNHCADEEHGRDENDVLDRHGLLLLLFFWLGPLAPWPLGPLLDHLFEIVELAAEHRLAAPHEKEPAHQDHP